MTWVAAAIIGGATALTGVLGYIGAGKAASDQKEASDLATGTQYRMFEEGREDRAPLTEKLGPTVNELYNRMLAGPGTFETSPGYQFRLGEGEKAIQNSAAAKGGLNSGATMKSLNNYAQGFATNDYQNFLANYYQSLTPFQSLAGLSQTSVNQGAQQGVQTGAGMANSITQGGNALATGQINQANAVTGAANSGVNNYLMWKYLQNPNNTYQNPTDFSGGQNQMGLSSEEMMVME